MAGSNPFRQLLPDISDRPPMIPADAFKGDQKWTPEMITLLRKAGVTASMVQQSIDADVQVSYDRWNMYMEIERSLEHWFVGAAVELYANVASTYNPIRNATVWVTSDSDTYEQELNGLLDRIGIEEKIHDWAFTVAGYGDLFMEVNGVPGLGIVNIDDGMHPMTISRVDYNGVLVGFYKSPQGQANDNQKADLIPPWRYVHFRLLGAKRKRPRFNDPGYTEMRQIHLITGADTKQLTTRYGTGITVNALPAYKRLRLAEDSLLLARVTRGIIRYIWKMKVDMNNAEAVSALMDQYAALITHARSIDTRENSPGFDSKQNPLTVIEDIFVPVWGTADDLKYEKIGGEADIRWIVDVDNLRQQLAFSLATPPALGGAYVQEASGSLGSEAIGKLDIRFSRSARRIQRALIAGITRLCQIHLAYKGMDPDQDLFQVHMSETSNAEEEQLRKNLETGLRTFSQFRKAVKGVMGRKLDPQKLWDYYNDKILKLEDFHLEDMLKSAEVLQKEEEMERQRMAQQQAEQAAKGSPPEEGAKGGEGKPQGATPTTAPEGGRRPVRLKTESVVASKRVNEDNDRPWRKHYRRPIENLDLTSYVPIIEKTQEKEAKTAKIFESVSSLDKTKATRPGKVGFAMRDALTWYKLAGSAKVVEAKDEASAKTLIEEAETELGRKKKEPEEAEAK